MADPMEEAKHEAEADAADERRTGSWAPGRYRLRQGGVRRARREGRRGHVPVARVRYGGGGGGGRGAGRKKKGEAGDADEVAWPRRRRASRTRRLHRAVGRPGHVQAHRRSGTTHGHRLAVPARRGDLGRHPGGVVAGQIAALRSPRRPHEKDGVGPPGRVGPAGPSLRRQVAKKLLVLQGTAGSNSAGGIGPRTQIDPN